MGMFGVNQYHTSQKRIYTEHTNYNKTTSWVNARMTIWQKGVFRKTKFLVIRGRTAFCWTFSQEPENGRDALVACDN